jgi:hypothetical protein
VYCPTVEYIRPRGTPSKGSIPLLSHPPQLSTFSLEKATL